MDADKKIDLIEHGAKLVQEFCTWRTQHKDDEDFADQMVLVINESAFSKNVSHFEHIIIGNRHI